jgi:hypothetical protein
MTRSATQLPQSSMISGITVRQSRATLVPCLRQALKSDRSGSFFAIDGSMLLVEVDPAALQRRFRCASSSKPILMGQIWNIG